MTCKGICIKYKAKRSYKKSWYNEHRRCHACDIFIKWTGLYCPCCGMKLRTTPRNKKSTFLLKKVKRI